MSQLMGAHVAGWILTAIVLLLLVVNGVVRMVRSRRRSSNSLFLSSAALLGIVAFIIAFWMVAILMSGDPGLGDPFRLLPRLVDSLHLDPVRDPQLFMLSLVIVGCAAATRSLLRRAIAMRTTGFGAMMLGFLVILVGVLRGPYG